MPTSHLQASRNPIQSHHRLPSQSRRHLHFNGVGFATLLQILLRPPPLLQLFQHQALRLLLIGLSLFLAAMMAPHSTNHHLQYLFPHLRPAQKPTPPHRLPFPRLFLPPPFFHGFGKKLPPCPVIPPDSQFTQHPIHPQPTRPLSRPLQILTITDRKSVV